MYALTIHVPSRPTSGIIRMGFDTQAEAELYRGIAILRAGALARLEFWPDTPPAPHLEHINRTGPGL